MLTREEYQRQFEESETRRLWLWDELRRRVLTEEEWQEVLRIGDGLNRPRMISGNGGYFSGHSFNAEEYRRDLDGALTRQLLMQVLVVLKERK